MKVLGVTGGIASGKSTICAHLASQFGVPLIETDKAAHRAYEPGRAAYVQVVELFGPQVVDRAHNDFIDRRALGAIVFGNPEKMRQLEEIVWPEMKTLVEEDLAKLGREGATLVIIESALLAKTGVRELCDEVWAVLSPLDLQLERLQKRNNLTREEAERRISMQVSNEAHAAIADRVIHNTPGITIEALLSEASQMWLGFVAAHQERSSERASDVAAAHPDGSDAKAGEEHSPLTRHT